jgi:DNA-binding transcriptional MerR regulator
MSTKHPEFILPEASEKLSYRFILDSVKDRLHKKTELEFPLEESVSDVNSEKAICGTHAQEPSTQLELTTAQVEIPEEEEKEALKLLELPVDKKYFRIGEVSELLKVEAYVLRYWESEFKTIKPVKSGSGHRVYSRKDVETLQVIKHLLYQEKFSIKGAKRKLNEKKKEVRIHQKSNSKALKEIATELRELVNYLRNP